MKTARQSRGSRGDLPGCMSLVIGVLYVILVQSPVRRGEITECTVPMLHKGREDYHKITVGPGRECDPSGGTMARNLGFSPRWDRRIPIVVKREHLPAFPRQPIDCFWGSSP